VALNPKKDVAPEDLDREAREEAARADQEEAKDVAAKEGREVEEAVKEEEAEVHQDQFL
jgi:hypothetical protein